MTRQLTVKQERFVHEYCTNGGNGTQAAISAGYSEATAGIIAGQNLKKLQISTAIEAWRAETAERAHVTVESLTAKYEEAFKLASSLDQPAAMVSAVSGIAKLHGLLTEDRKNDREPYRELMNWMAERGRDKPGTQITH